MMILFILVLVAQFNTSFAEPVIIDSQKIESYQKKLRENPYLLKRGFFKVQIDEFTLGKAITPFYDADSITKRFYQNVSQCYELSVLEQMNFVIKVPCYHKALELYLPGFEDYHAINESEIFKQGYTSFRVLDFNQKYLLKARLNPNDVNSITQNFEVQYQAYSDISVTKTGITLNQEVKLNVGNIGYLSERSSEIKNEFKLNPGAMVFSNGKGSFILYNSYLPKPFKGFDLKMNPQLLSKLKSLESDSKASAVCNLDPYHDPSAKDCHFMLMKSQSAHWIKFFDALKIDFEKKLIEFI